MHDEAGSDCPAVLVDAHHLLDVSAGVDRDEDGVGVLLVGEGHVFHEDVRVVVH